MRLIWPQNFDSEIGYLWHIYIGEGGKKVFLKARINGFSDASKLKNTGSLKFRYALEFFF